MNWKYNIKIKSHFTSQSDEMIVANLCQILIDKLSPICNNLYNSNFVQDEIDYFSNELEQIIDNFNFLKDLCDGTILEKDFDDFNYEGNYEEMFNGYLTELYDLCDKQIVSKNGTIYKFCWID